jgi:hypothetical protein
MAASKNSAAFMLVILVLIWLTSARPAQRIQTTAPAGASSQEQAKSSGGLGKVLLSTFGMFLLIVVLSSVTNNGINNQIANILLKVYGINQVTTSELISLAGLLNIGFFIVAGAWMARSGALPVYLMGNVLRLVGALGLALLGLATHSPVLLVATSMQVLYQANPFARLPQPAVTVRFDTVAAGAANGWALGASAAGSFIGSVLGGFPGFQRHQLDGRRRCGTGGGADRGQFVAGRSAEACRSNSASSSSGRRTPRRLIGASSSR